MRISRRVKTDLQIYKDRNKSDGYYSYENVVNRISSAIQREASEENITDSNNFLFHGLRSVIRGGICIKFWDKETEE